MDLEKDTSSKGRSLLEQAAADLSVMKKAEFDAGEMRGRYKNASNNFVVIIAEAGKISRLVSDPVERDTVFKALNDLAVRIRSGE
jgi:hypothetical protein